MINTYIVWWLRPQNDRYVYIQFMKSNDDSKIDHSRPHIYTYSYICMLDWSKLEKRKKDKI